MLASGILFVFVGLFVAFFSFGGGLLGMSLGYPTGVALISLGVLFAMAGAIVNAIERQGAAAVAEMRASREDVKKGIESLWAQLDRVRANTVPPVSEAAVSAAPSASGVAASTMGYCPGCGKLRGTNVLKCYYCGDMAPVRA